MLLNLNMLLMCVKMHLRVLVWLFNLKVSLIKRVYTMLVSRQVKITKVAFSSFKVP